MYNFIHPFNLIFYAILGVLCAGVGRFYTSTFYTVKNFFDASKIPKYIRPMMGAAICGIIGIFFPEVIGLGYGFLQFAINGNFSSITTNYVTLPVILILLLIVFLKIFATSFTVGSGGSGGVFAPSLAIGGFLGAAMWIVVHNFFPNLIPIPAPLVIVGMMALFAGVGRVPIAVILMVSEMTGNLSLLAPSMIAVVISYYLTGSKYTIYHSQVQTRADSPAHMGEYNVPLMTRIFVSEAMNSDVQSLNEDDSVQKANQLILEKGFKGIPIVSKEGKVLGMVTLRDVERIPREKSASTKLAEIMTQNVISAGPNETLLDALRKMTINEVGQLPVVDKSGGALLGIISRTDLLRAYDKRIARDNESTATDRD